MIFQCSLEKNIVVRVDFFLFNHSLSDHVEGAQCVYLPKLWLHDDYRTKSVLLIFFPNFSLVFFSNRKFLCNIRQHKYFLNNQIYNSFIPLTSTVKNKLHR